MAFKEPFFERPNLSNFDNMEKRLITQFINKNKACRLIG